jgi:polyisoprenoid-binding protein YceI
VTDIQNSRPDRPITGPDTPPQAIQNGEFIADCTRSELRFTAKAFTLIWVRGRMPAASGTIRVQDGKLSGIGEVAAAGVSTGIAARDWHLRTSHYLHAKRHPVIRMAVDDADLVTGTARCLVTVRNTTAPVTMTITHWEVVDGELHLEAAVELDRSPFPMLPPLAGVSRKVRIELIVVARCALPA